MCNRGPRLRKLEVRLKEIRFRSLRMLSTLRSMLQFHQMTCNKGATRHSLY